MYEKSKEQDIFYLFRLNLRDITSWSISSNIILKKIIIILKCISSSETIIKANFHNLIYVKKSNNISGGEEKDVSVAIYFILAFHM